LAVAERPEPSVTVQITVVAPTGNAAGALFNVDETEQLSAVTGVPRAGAAVQIPAPVETLTPAGAVIVGFWLSATMTSCAAEAVRPCTSVVVHVTVFEPSAYVAVPLFTVPEMAQLSAVTGVPRATPDAVQMPASVLTFTVAGAEIVGSCVSVTVSDCVAVFWLP